MSEWQPMETAPQGMDNEVLVWDGRVITIAAVWWHDDEEQSLPAWFTGEYRVYPTHWMPLPAPPPPTT
jgi:hypothetical protein